MRYLVLLLLAILLLANTTSEKVNQKPKERYETFIFATVVDEGDVVMDSVIVNIIVNGEFSEIRGTRGYLLLKGLEGTTYSMTFKKNGYCTKTVNAVIQDNYPIIFFVELFEVSVPYIEEPTTIMYSKEKGKYITTKGKPVKINK